MSTQIGLDEVILMNTHSVFKEKLKNYLGYPSYIDLWKIFLTCFTTILYSDSSFIWNVS